VIASSLSESPIRALAFALLQIASVGNPDPTTVTSPRSQANAAILADSLYAAGDFVRSIGVSVGDSASEAVLDWRAARAFIALGMLEGDDARRRVLYDSALFRARRALSSAPTSLDARYWLAAAAGRRASRREPLYSAQLVREVYEQATAILAVDSLHAGAHHALGRLHSELLRVPAAVRFVLAHTGHGDALRQASATTAEFHLRRAVELEPGMSIYLADLGDFYAKSGRRAEALEIARRLAALEPRLAIQRQARDAFLHTVGMSELPTAR
jgi:tetratricopeptide (TPR) repeat protein